MDFFKPPKWKYEPIAMIQQRKLAAFDTMRDQISPLVASGDPISMFKARQIVQQAKTPPEAPRLAAHGFLQKIGDDVRKRIADAQANQQAMAGAPDNLQVASDQMGHPQTPSRPIPGVMAGVQAAFPETQGAGPVYNSGTASGTDVLKGVGGTAKAVADTGRGAVIGGLKDPLNFYQGVATGVENPGAQSGRDIVGVRNLSDSDLRLPTRGGLVQTTLSPRDIGGGVADVAADPLTYVGAGGGAHLAEQGAVTEAERVATQEADPIAARVAEAVQQKFRPRPLAADLSGGAPAMSPTIKGTTGALDLGDSGIKDALAAKAEALHRPGGPIYGPEGSTRRSIIGSVVNPSANMPQEVHVANNARIGVQHSLYGDFSRTEGQAASAVKQAFEANPPTYLGTDKSAVVGTAVDFLERPSQYTNVSPELAAAKDAWGQAQLDNLNRVRAQYNGDVAPFTGPDPQGVYVPHVAAKDDLEQAVQSTSASLSSRTAITKARAYETLHDRLLKQPDFKPELDLNALADTHAQSLATIAGNNTFKDGVGGLTRPQVMEQLHPKLYARMTALRQQLQGLRGTAGRLDATTDQTIQDFLNSPQDPADLSNLLSNLEPTVGNYRGAPGVNFGKTEADINAQIKQVRDAARQLRPAWESASTGDYVLSTKTFRYHTPEQASAIDSVLKTKVNNSFIEGSLQAANEITGMALGPDFSPLTIQGALGAASHPEVLIKDGATMAKVAFGGRDALMAATDPEVVRRYEFATGRQFGNIGSEFRQEGRGFERIPGVKKPLRAFNDALQRVTEYGTLKAWENDSNILQHFGVPQNIADHEAANSISKFLPRLNPAETGRSVQRARIERAPLISTSFKYAPPLVAKDITSGIAKLAVASMKNGLNEKAAWQSLDGREQLALIRGAALATTLMTASVASAVASAHANGKNPADAVKEVVDPTSARFMSLILGDKGSVGLGGPMRSAIRGFAPGYVNGKMIPFARLPKYVAGSLSPALSTPVALLRNKDYLGNKIVKGDFPENFARAFEYGLESANLIGGAPLADIRTGQGNPITDTFSQIGGTNYFDRTPTDKLDEAARKQFGSSYYNLEPFQQKAIRDANPDAWAQSVSQGTQKRQAAQDVKAQYQTQQENRDKALLGGTLNRKDYVNQYYDDLTAKRAKLEQIYGATPITKPKNPTERYIQILQQATDPQTNVLNHDKVDAGMATLTADDKAYIARNVGLEDTSVGQVFRDVRATRSARNDLPKYAGFNGQQAQKIDDMWQEIRNLAGNPPIGQSISQLAMMRARRMYLAQNPNLDPAIVSGVTRRIMGNLRTVAARTRYDRAHPEQALFYGSGNLTAKDQALLQSLVANKTKKAA